MKHRWRDGTTHVVFEPRELVEKLAALVPPPRFHTARYHGILAPCASARERVVPGIVPREDQAMLSTCEAHGEWHRAHPGGAVSDRPPPPTASCDPADVGPPAASAATPLGDPTATPERRSPSDATPRPRRLSWSELLRRVFAVDVLRCPDCGSRMRLLAAIHPPEASEAILACLGLPVRAPPIAPPKPEDAAPAGNWADSVDALPPGDFDA